MSFLGSQIFFRGVSGNSLKKVLQNPFRVTLEPSVFSYLSFLTKLCCTVSNRPLRKYRFGQGHTPVLLGQTQKLKRSYLWPTIRAQSVLKNNIIAGYQRKTVGRADPVCRFRPYLTLKYLYVLFQEV